jgi:hypothetical protein
MTDRLSDRKRTAILRKPGIPEIVYGIQSNLKYY